MLRRCRGFLRWRSVAAWTAVAIWAGLIWKLSSMSDLGPIEEKVGWLWFLKDLPFRDKIAHATEFGVLALLVINALRPSALKEPSWPIILAAVGLCFVYGCVDEAHQVFVPNRTPDVFDLMADTTGAALAAIFVPNGIGALSRVRTRAASPTVE